MMVDQQVRDSVEMEKTIFLFMEIGVPCFGNFLKKLLGNDTKIERIYSRVKNLNISIALNAGATNQILI